MTHRELLQYLNQLVRNTCPPYLRNDQDDIAQTALIRLINKIDTMEKDLQSCRILAQQTISERQAAPLVDILAGSLEEIEKSCDRRESEQIRIELRKCSSWIQRGQESVYEDEILKSLEKSLGWLRDKDGKDIFTDFYIQRGVHWAILDAKKRYIRLAEVSAEETEEAYLEWSTPPSLQRVLEIRDEISECLHLLDEDKRRPTLLALLGYKYSEIAEFLGLSIGQVEGRVRRGKDFLRECLDPKGVFP